MRLPPPTPQLHSKLSAPPRQPPRQTCQCHTKALHRLRAQALMHSLLCRRTSLGKHGSRGCLRTPPPPQLPRAHPSLAALPPPTPQLRRALLSRPPRSCAAPLRSAAAASPTDTPVQRKDPSPTSSAGGGALTLSECQRVLDLAHAVTDPPEAATLAASDRKRARWSAGRGRRDTSVPAASSSGASPGSRVPVPSREPARVEAREEVQVEVHEDTRSCAAPLVTLSGGPCPNT
jgi:hypothetical protein